MKKIRIQINSKNFHYGRELLPVGRKVAIEVDKNGKPIDTFWRKRLEDAKNDKSIEIVKKKKVIKEKKEKDNNKNKENK